MRALGRLVPEVHTDTMISSVRFVPAGVADPNPKRYEMSVAEQEILDMMGEEPPVMDETKEETKNKLAQVPKNQNLPADLRMDEYSSDEDEDGNNMAVGELLIGKQTLVGESDDELEEGVQWDQGSDSDSDDDLTDVPDTREYEPVDVQALESMGLGTGGIDDVYGDEEDDSEAEDVKLTEDDVLVLVAKTEDVRN